ncbi:MAG: peptidase, partial [Gemmatimonadaceae bacterium]
PDRVIAQPARGSATRTVGRAEEFWLAGGATHTTTIRIRSGTAAAAKRLTLRALSTRGGVAEREVSW